MGHHAEAVGTEKNRPATRLAVGRVDAPGQRGGGLPAGHGFPEAAGNQHHRFHRVGFDDFIDEFVDRAGGHGDDQHVQFVIQRLQAGDTLDTINLGLAGTNDAHAVLAVAAAHQVAQNDPAEIHVAGRDSDNPDRGRMNEFVDLVHRAGQTSGRGCAEVAMRGLNR